MSRTLPPRLLPTASEIAHAPEIPILIALDTLLAMTTVTIHLALPDLDLVQRTRELLDPDLDDPNLAVAQDVLDRIHALRNTLQVYQDLALRP